MGVFRNNLNRLPDVRGIKLGQSFQRSKTAFILRAVRRGVLEQNTLYFTNGWNEGESYSFEPEEENNLLLTEEKGGMQKSIRSRLGSVLTYSDASW